VTVEVELQLTGRLDQPKEAALYFTASEALTNVVKYAGASSVSIRVYATEGFAMIEIKDDGIGGADPERGSGLRGLGDRVEAVGGWLSVTSPPGAGTTVVATVPL
jgi:signal transduction histidine kinase